MASQQVSQRAVRLMFQIWHGHQPAGDVAYYLEYLSLHLPEARLELALSWLLRNDIRGPKFMDFIEEQCARSALELMRQVTRGIEREKEVRPIMASDMRFS